MRLFIAIDLPPQVKQELFDLSRTLERQADAGRAIPLENFHLTLVFIGETARLASVTEVMDAVCRARLCEPLRFALSGIGSFKGHRGHNWWVGVEAAPELEALANSLADGLRAEGFPIERRSFRPHVTIGRNVVTSCPIELHPPTIELASGIVSLMRSDRKNGRQVYSELHSCEVGG
ncbi:MAG: RNA 2',3'-cyclic phosphodiesterase [Coriobacteriales bacterium]|jgi:2'-5' RNA ligase|nr:RNA 2',3'-cyclic phosphodiesterase [Coriobacteriales bacterium]